MSTSKEKIAIFHNLPPGGAKRYLYEISKRLKKKYILHEYTTTTSSDYLSLKKIVEISKHYEYQKGRNILEYVFNAIFKLRSLHKKIAADIDLLEYKYVLVNHDFITKSPYLLSFVKHKTIYFCHEPQREFYEPQFLHSPKLKDKISNLIRLPIKLIDIENARKATVLVANSKYSQRILKRVYKLNSKIIFPGVDSIFFKKLAKSKKNQIISVGGLLPVKGHEFVIQSIAMLKEEVRPTLLIVGDGRNSDKERISKLAKSLSVKLKITGNVSDSEMVKLYNSSLCLASAAYSEPFGMSIIEAMSCQTPVVAVKNGGVGEQIINGKTGYVLPNRNKKKFADKLHLAIQKSKFLGNNAHQYVAKKWQWEKSIESLERIVSK